MSEKWRKVVFTRQKNGVTSTNDEFSYIMFSLDVKAGSNSQIGKKLKENGSSEAK